jgi:hypothetical protein
VKRDTVVRAPFILIDNFLPDDVAKAMRTSIERHFENPYGHSSETHMVWNYWYVPNLYTYLRTQPELVWGRIWQRPFTTG